MAGTTTDGFRYAEATDPWAPSSDSAAEATSIQEWADTRQIPDYYWADAAARTAQTGMANGDEGFQADTGMTYKYNGSTWKAWHTLSPVNFTPTWTNLTVGNATQTFRYTLAAGTVQVSGFLILGTTSSVGTAPHMTAPLPLNGYITGAPNSGSDQILGTAIMADNGGVSYTGPIATVASASVIYVRPLAVGTGATYASTLTLTSTVPFTFGSTDYMTFNYSYQAD